MPETAAKTSSPAPQAAAWGMPLALALLVVVLVVTAFRLTPPAPRPATAPAGEFSATRAWQVLVDLAGPQQSPRPLGSAAGAATRDRILAHLRQVGYTPRVETSFACSVSTCGEVNNVIAELPGQADSSVPVPGAILLTAHYDSAAAGPGIADDLSGVAAILEVARALHGEPVRNPVLFVLDEGEEASLLGARAFAATPLAARVRAVVNLEARGSRGPSLMFETGSENAWLLPLFHPPHPLASSVFTTLYDRLPNDTDFSIFKRQGLTGFNFAFVEGQFAYHTSVDDLSHLSMASLQHQGDNALAVTRALAGADLGQPGAPPHPGRAVFFDLWGLTVVSWPAARGVLLGGITLALVVVAAARLALAGKLTRPGLLRALLTVPAASAITFVVAYGVTRLLQLPIFGPGLRMPWPARTSPAVGTFWFLALMITFLLANWLRRARYFPLWTGVWLAWAVAGLILAVKLPGVSYLFLVPALAAGLLGLILPRGPGAATLASVIPAVVAAIVWLPIVVLLYSGLGTGGVVIIATAVALVATTIVPLIAPAGLGWRVALPGISGVMTMVMMVGILASPVFSKESPRRLTYIYHVDADSGSARFLAQTPPPLMPVVRKAAEFTKQPAREFPFSLVGTFATAAPVVRPDLLPKAPELTVVNDATVDGKRRVTLHFVSPRGARAAVLAIPDAAAAESIRVAGHELGAVTGGKFDQQRRQSMGGYRLVNLATLPAAGLDLEVVLGSASHEEWVILDRTPGLPDSADTLVKARPAETCRFQEGDRTEVSRKVRI